MLHYSKADGYEEAGVLLLSFLDETGCQVTIKVTEALVEDLAQRFTTPPEQP